MNLKESFDNCISGLGCLAVVVMFFAWCGYVCYMSLFQNTIGVLGYLIGTVLLIVMVVSAWIILCSMWYFIRDAWKEKRKNGENGDLAPDEAAGAAVQEGAGRADPYEAAVLLQTEARGDGDVPEVHEISRTKANLTLIKNALYWLVVLACSVLLYYDCSRTEKQRDETKAAVLCMDGMTAYRAKDYDAAVPLFTKAAEQGSAKAKYMLGICCYDGTGTEKDWDAAFRWFYKAAKQDYRDALYRLGVCYEQAIGTKRDMEKALVWWVKAAKLGLGQAEAQYRAGLTAITVFGEFDDGVAWLRRSAEQGNPFAMRFLGFVYEGKDKAESDAWYRKAAEALYRAAKHGDPRAQHDLAGLYRDGIGVPKDSDEAGKWFELAAKNYRAAAEHGDPEAQCKLGGFYQKGVGVEQDEAEAVKWFRKAAEQGFMKGESLLGLAYFEGKGVEKDEAEGVRWLRAAAEQGDPDARAFLDAQGK